MTAHDLIAANRYMTIATADAQGTPWVSPVWFAPSGDAHLLWVSDPAARHSRNIAARPEIAIVVFDSRVEVGSAEALYLQGTAQEVAGEELQPGIDAFSEHSVRGGAMPWTLADVTAPARHRLYRATIAERWVLGPGDQRIPIR
jgi:nitroimidazol reductase NimA-like FMN-containing flavoprotein (pyridoxamine 5'-phosphate oxidase superfamily)